MDRASNRIILFGCWRIQLHEKFEWDTVQTGELVPVRKLLLPSSGEKTGSSLTKDWGNSLLQNFGAFVPDYMMSQARW
jgi:hypothetical protein